MAIKSNKKIDFEYEHENDGEIYSISLRLHNSSEYGSSIGVLDENGDVAINFPVGMFSEITDFLIDQGVLEGKKIVSAPPIKLPRPINKNNTPAKTISLPKPKIVSNKTTLNSSRLNTGVTKDKDVIDLDLEQGYENDYQELPVEIQQKIAEENMRNNINEALEGSTPAMSLHSSAQQIQLSDDEIANIMQERSVALQKQSETKKIKKK